LKKKSWKNRKNFKKKHDEPRLACTDGEGASGEGGLRVAGVRGLLESRRCVQKLHYITPAPINLRGGVALS
jgi:hypothetical protein